MDLACFTAFQPRPVITDSLAYSSERNLVAHGLEDGSIEIFSSEMVLRGRIPGSESRSVRRLAFFEDVLISCGVHGSATMWDVNALSEIATVDSSQGALWDMAISGHMLYLASETGCVVVVDISHRSMAIHGFLRPSSPARALSLCVQGDKLFVGDASGKISRWSMSTQICDATFSIPVKNDKPVLIWQLVAVGASRIASGDSLGVLSIWDSHSCTLIQSRQDHQADILALRSSGTELISGSVDARITRYSTAEDSLKFLSVDSVMSRDITAVAVLPTFVLVGGADARLVTVTRESDRMHTTQLNRFRESSVVVTATSVLCKTGCKSISMYSKSGTLVAEFENKVDVSAFAANDESNRVVIAGTDGSVRVLNVDVSKHTVALAGQFQAIGGMPVKAAVSGQWIVVASANGEVTMVKGDKFDSASTKLFCEGKGSIVEIAISGKSLVGAAGRTLSVLNLDKPTAQIKHHEFTSDITAMTATGNHILIATASHTATILSHTLTVEWEQSFVTPRLPQAFVHVHHIISLPTTSARNMILIGESFALTLTNEADGFKFNSTVPMGGVVVGAGVCEGTPLVVLAGYKATKSVLVQPFERKAFHH